MRKNLIYWLAAFVILSIGCQKELSFEGSNLPAKGSLQFDVTGDCLPKTVNGTYIGAIPLVPATNTITVEVNITSTGPYVVSTDTVNGYFFRATGTFFKLGANTITLRGNGTPFAGGVNNFVVTFDSTFCDIQVTVLPVGSGPAAFTLVSGGTPANCASAVVSGTYVKDIPLGAPNFVDITVNVTTVGAYTIKATGGGMVFQKTGTFALTGNQTVRLVGTGIPTSIGANTITFDPPFASCSFTVTTTGPAVGTCDCSAAVISGTYTVGAPMLPANTVQIAVTVTTTGPYSITTDTVSGIWFNASGNFPTAATVPVTLVGNGTPTGSGGPTIFTVKFGASTCTFTVTIGTGVGVFTADCTTATPDINGLFEAGTQLNCSNTVDIDVNVTALGPYTITTTLTNGMVFSASGTFATLGNQTITLVGSGTPIAPASPSNIPMPGTVPCTFPITVDVPLPIDWQFTRTNTPSTIFRGQTDFATMVPNGTAINFGFIGSNSISSDALTFLLSDISGNITAGETYSTAGLPIGNFAAFQYALPGNCMDTYSADLTTIGAAIIFSVTSNNVVTRTITGTFTGTAKNGGGGTITITTGTFTATY